MKLNKYAEHLIEICTQNRIFPLPVEKVFHSAACVPERIVLIKPPETYFEYGVALHELGHIMDGAIKTQNTSKQEEVATEIRAWNWARSNAPTWHPDMEKAVEMGIESHTAPRKLDANETEEFYRFIDTREKI